MERLLSRKRVSSSMKFCFVVAILLVSADSIFAQSKSSDPNNGRAWDAADWDYRPLHSADLIVRGSITSVADKDIASGDFWMQSPGSGVTDHVATVTLHVEEVLRGSASSASDVTFLVYRDPAETRIVYSPGDQMIVCLYFHPRLNMYYQTSTYSRYQERGTRWASGASEASERVFDEGELRKKIAEVSIDAVASDAALVVIGRVESVKHSGLVGPDGSSAEVVTLGLRVQEVQKGDVSEELIPISFIIRGAYRPSWRRDVPREYSVGQTWWCFLRKNDLGWYPFAGSNGLFQSKNGKLIYAGRVEYWNDGARIRHAIEASREEKSR